MEDEIKYIGGRPYTRNDLDRDIAALVRIGLIEAVGITEEGKWIYAATEKSNKMSEADRLRLIIDSYEDEINGNNFM
jgi:hypothetical protein